MLKFKKKGNNNVWETSGGINGCSDSGTWGTYTVNISEYAPGRKVFICAPNKSQGAQIAKEKLTEIFRYWPLLRKEVVGGEVSDTPGNYGKDYVSLKFRNGSVFDVVGALESTLGGRRHSGLIDEIKNHDETAINTIVLPLLNVSRRLPNGATNPKEPN